MDSGVRSQGKTNISNDYTIVLGISGVLKHVVNPPLIPDHCELILK